MSRYKARPSASDAGSFDILAAGKYVATVAATGKLIRGKCSVEDALDAIWEHENPATRHKAAQAPTSQPMQRAKPTGVPQVIVSLDPFGNLKLELPGCGGVRRAIAMRDSEAVATLKRVLAAQAAGDVEIGFDGAPTTQQLKHWERHEQWPDASCRFCLAEDRIRPSSKRQRRATLIARTGDIEIKRLAAITKRKRSDSAASVVIVPKRLEELDL